MGVLATWFFTGGLEGGGNPVASVLVGFAIALIWARGFMQLEKRYLRGEFDRVLRWLPLWEDSVGATEAFLLRVWIMIETRRNSELESLIQEGSDKGMGTFLNHWAQGHRARLDQAPDEALQTLHKGIEEDTFGMDRAELQCEAAKILLEASPHQEEAETLEEDWLEAATALSNEAGSLLRTIEPNSDSKSRYSYLSLFHRGLRGLIYMRQRRWAQANRVFEEVIGQASNQSSLRGRRLARHLEINRLRVLYQSHGIGRFSQEREKLTDTGLPELKLRLSEIEQEVRDAEEAADEEQGESDPFLSDPEAFSRYQERRIQQQEARQQPAEIGDHGMLEDSPEEELDDRLRTQGIDDEDKMVISMEDEVFDQGQQQGENAEEEETEDEQKTNKHPPGQSEGIDQQPELGLADETARDAGEFFSDQELQEGESEKDQDSPGSA